MKKILEKILEKGPGNPSARLAPAIAQVEVTTRCNLKCTMCPRTHFSGEKNLDFSWEVFEKFSEFFPKLNLVHLQGWGEPLLHPHIFDMAALVRQKNTPVAFTTNGSLLDKNVIEAILRLPVQHVTVSLAGADSSVHEAIRVGSDFDALLGRVSNLVEARKKKAQREPIVHLSYLVTRDSVSGLPEMVKKAHEIGVDRLVAPNLDCPVTKAEEDRRIFGFDAPDKDFQRAVDDAQIKANKLKFRLDAYPLQLPDDILVCELNPLTQFFVNVHGDVAPCTYASVMGRSDYTRYFLQQEVPTAPLIFGSLVTQDMETIWNQEDYQRFRRHYQRRMQAYADVSMKAANIHSIFGLKDFIKEIDRVLIENPLPDFCTKCYKAYGA